MSDDGANDPDEAAARDAFVVLERLCAQAERAPMSRRPALVAIARAISWLRLLDAWAADPLRTLAGRYVSLDAWRLALDNAASEAVTGACVGRCESALFIPSRNAAVRVCVFAVADPDLPPGLVRHGPMSDDLVTSSALAYRAVDALLERLGRSSAGGVHLSVAVLQDDSPGNFRDDWPGRAAGHSLALPMALALLSARSGVGIKSEIAATGGLAATGETLSVGQIGAKRAVLLGYGRRLLTPDDCAELIGATRHALADDGWSLRRLRRGNLPAPRTSLVGRGAECARIAERLIDSRGDGARLLALTGPAGVGKTRLLLAAADAAMDAFPDGVWFMTVEKDATAETLAIGIAGAMGLTHASGCASVMQALSNRRLLLALDELDNASAAGDAYLSALLAAAPGVRALATARGPVGVAGAARVVVAPLSPEAAVALLKQRAIDAGVTPERLENQQALTDLCARCDGLPLAIELAASQMRVAPPGSLRGDGLETLLDRTMESLGAGAVAALLRLSVFAQGFETDAAAAVLGVSVAEAHGTLAELEAHSLIVCSIAGDRILWRLLNPVRLAVGRRLGPDDALAVRRAHASWIRSCWQRLLDHDELDRWSDDIDEVAAMDELTVTLADIRAALGFLLAAGEPTLPEAVSELWPFLRRRVSWSERDCWSEAALAAVSGDSSELIGRLQLCRASVLGEAGRHEDALAAAQAARAAIESLGASPLLAQSLLAEGESWRRLDQSAEALGCIDAARALFQAIGAASGEVDALRQRAALCAQLGQEDAAQQQLAIAIALGRASGAQRGTGYACLELGRLERARGVDSGRARFAEAVRLGRMLRDPLLVGRAWQELGRVGDGPQSLLALALGVALYERVGHSEEAFAARELERQRQTLSESARAELDERLTRWRRLDLNALCGIEPDGAW